MRRTTFKKFLISLCVLLMIWIYAEYYILPDVPNVYAQQNSQSQIQAETNGLPWWKQIFAKLETVDFHTPNGNLSPIFTREVQYWGNSIVRWANDHGVDPNLAATVMQVESCGDPKATSRAGAMGLFQVMPVHFQKGENGYQPETNALRGLNYLKRSLDKAGGNARLAMAGYNGGIGVISRGEWSWAAETRRYATYSQIYYDASSGATESAALNEWYSKYGAGLCKQAAKRIGLP